VYCGVSLFWNYFVVAAAGEAILARCSVVQFRHCHQTTWRVYLTNDTDCVSRRKQKEGNLLFEA